MSAEIIDGKAVAAKVREEVKREVEGMGRKPGLATILVGDDPASAVYVGSKARACAEAGFEAFGHVLPAGVAREDVLALIDRLNDDPRVDGILCQLPAPPHLDGAELAARVAPHKDVDGLSPASAGALALGLPGLCPCTPLGVMRLIAESGVALRGAEATVVGCSNLVGKPVARLLQQADATVTQCHVHTADLAAALALPLDVPATAAQASLAIIAELAVRDGVAGPLLLAATGRSGLPPGFSVL